MKDYMRKGTAVVMSNKRIYEEAKARKAKNKKIDEMDDRLTRIEQMLERLLDEQKT